MRVYLTLIACAFSTAFYAQINCSLVTDTAVGFGFLPTSLPLSNKIYNATGNSVTTVPNGQITANCVVPENVTLLASGNLVFTNGFKASSSSSSTFKAVVGTCTPSGAKSIEKTTDPFSVSEILIYPNPTKDQVLISWNNTKISKITVLNPLGKVLYTSNNLSKTNQFNLNLSQYSAGIYQVVFEDNNKFVTLKRIIKE